MHSLLVAKAENEFFRDYALNLRPATDHLAYFFHFFRWRALPLMLHTFRQSWIPFSEWGYLILVATLGQATFLGILLIVFPRILLPRQRTPNDSPVARPLGGGAARLQVLF